MLRRLRAVFDDVVISMVMKYYYKDVYNWVNGALDFRDEIERTMFMQKDGRTLIMVLLWSYGNFEVEEIAELSGKDRGTVYNRLKKGRELLRKKGSIESQRFRKLYQGFRLKHVALMEKYFKLEFELDYEKEEIEFEKVTDAFVYMKLGGERVRIGIDELRGLTHIANMVYSTKKGAILRRIDLLEV